ncbi:MAG: hypothetical protein R6X32_03785 [Chloroflexota bacterium]
MMKQRIVLLVGLTAVSLPILLTSCTQPTTPATLEATTLPTVMPTANFIPQVTPSPQRHDPDIYRIVGWIIPIELEK